MDSLSGCFFASACLVTILCLGRENGAASAMGEAAGIDPRQVPGWTAEDMEFFLHGSMSTEIVPERVLRAFIRTYPDLFPKSDFTEKGMIPDTNFGWPIGFSRARVEHLGGQMSVGINCAVCHVGEIRSGEKTVRVLGMTSHFDVEAFFGALIVSTFRTTEPANMKKFLAAYLTVNGEKEEAGKTFESLWERQEKKSHFGNGRVSGRS